MADLLVSHIQQAATLAATRVPIPAAAEGEEERDDSHYKEAEFEQLLKRILETWTANLEKEEEAQAAMCAAYAELVGKKYIK